MKTFLQNTPYVAQYLTEEILRKIFSIPMEDMEEAKKEFYILQETLEDEKYKIQIAFNGKQCKTNNFYLVVLSDKDGDIHNIFAVESLTSFPPVWNREFGQLDYYDFLNIQMRVIEDMRRHNAILWTLNTSPKNKSFYFTKEKLEEVLENQKNGEPSHIICLFC